MCAFIDGSGVLDMALSFTAVFKLSPMLFNFGGIWAESVSKAYKLLSLCLPLLAGEGVLDIALVLFVPTLTVGVLVIIQYLILGWPARLQM